MTDSAGRKARKSCPGSWLIVGGAGYIGSHVTRELRRRGHRTVVLDDLSTGLARRIVGPAIIGSVADQPMLLDTFQRHRITGVVHLAGSKQVAESIIRPERYYANNVTGLLVLLQTMVEADVDRIVFSSSAAVYGDTDGRDITEDASTAPINPYGRTKLIGEWAIRDFALAHNLAYAILRYFNVAGTAHPTLADTNSTNLIPQVVRALKNNEAPVIYGTDYATPDGTCIRDFVDVRDLAAAHADAIGLIEHAKHQTLNVGSGHGYSVSEVITTALSLAGSQLQPRRLPRRAGDPTSVVAATGRITSATGWRARHRLSEIIASTMRPQPDDVISTHRATRATRRIAS